MNRPKKIVYKVQCAYEQQHVFDKTFVIAAGSEQVQSAVEAFCPFCDKMVTVTVQGKLIPDAALLRKFGLA